MRKILIIGSSGLLGSKLMTAYASDYQLFGTYKEHNISMQNTYQLDVTQQAEVEKLLTKLEPDLIIDTHGITSLDYCEKNKEEAWKVNVDGTKNIAESAKAIGCKYIFISTDAVFDGKKTELYTETDKPNPINYYGTTKAIAEKTIDSLDLDYIICRTSTLFGKGGLRKFPSFINWVTEQLKNKQKIQVVTDQYNNPTYTDNLAQFIRALYEKDAKGIFHTTGKDTISRFEFANKIAEVFNLDKSLISPTTTAELNLIAKRSLRTGLDISKVEEVTSLKGIGIGEALNAFKNSF